MQQKIFSAHILILFIWDHLYFHLLQCNHTHLFMQLMLECHAYFCIPSICISNHKYVTYRAQNPMVASSGPNRVVEIFSSFLAKLPYSSICFSEELSSFLFWLWRRNSISIIQPFVFPFSKASYFFTLDHGCWSREKKNCRNNNIFCFFWQIFLHGHGYVDIYVPLKTLQLNHFPF